MSTEFLETTIGSVCEVGDGAHAKVKRQDSGILYLTSKNLGTGYLKLDDVDYISEKDYEKLFQESSKTISRLIPGDILIGIIGTFGNAYLYKDNDRFGISSSVGIIRSDKNILYPKFLYYVVASEYFKSTHAAYKSGSVQGYTNIATIKSLPVTIPPLSEQKAIASILSSLDDKIELNRRMNETLEAMARAIFKDWFVDFGPTRAKQEGRAAYLPEHLWSLFPEAIDPETGLPIGWELGTLERLAELNPESWTTKKHPEFIKYVDLANTKWGEIEKIELYEWGKAPSRARRVLNSGDTIVGTVRPGNGSYALISNEDLTGSTGFAVLRPRRFSDSIFVWAVATSESNIERLQHLADGGAYPAVRPEVVIQTEVNLPALTILDAYSEIASPIMEKGNRNRLESRTLAELRDRLLPKLMSGEIRVKEAEGMIEEVK